MDQEEEPTGHTKTNESRGSEKYRSQDRHRKVTSKNLGMGRKVDQARKPIREKEWAQERNRENKDQKMEDLMEDKPNEGWNNTAPRTGQPERKMP